MKSVIFILVLFGLVGVVGAFTNLHTIIGGYSLVGRGTSLLFGIAALIGAVGCYRRAPFGWYLVEALVWLSIASAIARTVFVAWTLHLPLAGTVLGGIGEGVKIMGFAFVVVPFWLKQRKNFFLPNQSLDPTFASGTSPAVQEPRHR